VFSELFSNQSFSRYMHLFWCTSFSFSLNA